MTSGSEIAGVLQVCCYDVLGVGANPVCHQRCITFLGNDEREWNHRCITHVYHRCVTGVLLQHHRCWCCRHFVVQSASHSAATTRKSIVTWWNVARTCVRTHALSSCCSWWMTSTHDTPPLDRNTSASVPTRSSPWLPGMYAWHCRWIWIWIHSETGFRRSGKCIRLMNMNLD